jgi:hypothetical protein
LRRHQQQESDSDCRQRNQNPSPPLSISIHRGPSLWSGVYQIGTDGHCCARLRAEFNFFFPRPPRRIFECRQQIFPLYVGIIPQNLFDKIVYAAKPRQSSAATTPRAYLLHTFTVQFTCPLPSGLVQEPLPNEVGDNPANLTVAWQMSLMWLLKVANPCDSVSALLDALPPQQTLMLICAPSTGASLQSVTSTVVEPGAQSEVNPSAPTAVSKESVIVKGKRIGFPPDSQSLV